MIQYKKVSLNILLFALFCGTFSIPSQSATKKKKKKSSVTSYCIACLNSFDSEKLIFTIDETKCPKQLAKCYKTNYSNQCEGIIQSCIADNCKQNGSCSDEIGNRSLFYGCLKSVNIILPYQCASYISGYASSKASEVKALATAQENAVRQQEINAQNAAAEAEKAKANAQQKSAQITADAEIEKQKIEAENKLKLEEQKAILEQQAKEAELARQKNAEKEARNNKPNVKYNNLLNEVKQSITTAKNYSTKAYNLLGITKTDKEQTNGSAIFFPPQIISMSGIYASSDAKTKSLVNSSRYKSDANFVCTKNTKESYIKNELNNIYNTIKKSRDNLSNGIAEIESVNADDEATNTISDSKITTLYQAQNKLTEIMETIEGYTSNLKTSCETRCEGLTTFSPSSYTSSKPIEFDENGNIIEEKRTNNNEYSCKDFETNSSSTSAVDIVSLFGTEAKTASSAKSDIFGGIGKKVAELTKRSTESVLYTDKLLDEALIAVQSGKFGDDSPDYPAIDTCTQYMVLDIKQYANCISNVLGQQLTALSHNKQNKNIMQELNSSLYYTYQTLKSPNFKENREINLSGCGENITENTFSYSDYNEFYNCTLSMTNALNNIKQSGETTGKFNFQIVDAEITGTEEKNQNIYLNDGTVINPTSFASKKLGWKDVSKCSINVVMSKTEQNFIGLNGPSNMTTTNGINMSKSTLVCACKDADSTSTSLTFQQINYGNYSKECNQEQRK